MQPTSTVALEIRFVGILHLLCRCGSTQADQLRCDPLSVLWHHSGMRKQTPLEVRAAADMDGLACTKVQ